MPNPSNISEAEFVRPRSLEKNKNPMLEVLRIYCLGMLKACELVNEQVRSEHFYEVRKQNHAGDRKLTLIYRRKIL